ncbi:invasion associated locus B family protein [Sediminicoccus sp. KRV36]|nr:invasion associated locus B family protein [Sediminicoccus rosea]
MFRVGCGRLVVRWIGIVTLLLGVAACGPPQPLRTYVPATIPEPTWQASCQADRFSDQNRCEVRRRISSQTLGVAEGSLWTTDAGRSWTITVSPPPVTYRLRVGQNAVIEGLCRGPAGSCTVVNSQQLTTQMRAGTTLAIQVTTVRGGQIDRDIPLAGLSDALAEAQRRSPPPPNAARQPR